MSFCISRKLRDWVETGLKSEKLQKSSDEEIAGVLWWDERHGYAMRALDRHGKIVWKPTRKLLKELAALKSA